MHRKAVGTFLCTALLFLLSGPLFAQRIDLTGRELFIRNGFSPDWITSLPAPADPSWLRLPPSVNGLRRVRVKELPLPGIPRHTFMSPRQHHPREFTFVTSFDLPVDPSGVHAFRGLHLGHIGNNYELYMNGSLIKREMFLSPTGELTRSRSTRALLVYIPPSTLRPGSNVLAFRVVGDPTHDLTGLYNLRPYLIDDYEKLAREFSDIIPLLLSFLYLFVGVYHVFLFVNRPKETANLFYGLFTLAIFCYFMFRIPTTYRYFQDTDTRYRLEILSLFCIFPLASAFLNTILHREVRRFTIVYGGIMIAFMIPVFVVPIVMVDDLVFLWQLTAPVPLVYCIFIELGGEFYRTLRSRTQRGGIANRTLPYRLYRTLRYSVPGNLLQGGLVLFACAIFDIVDSMTIGLGYDLTRYGFFVFIISITFVLANRFIYVHKEIESLNSDMMRSIGDLNKANARLSLSEKEYKFLVEGARDFVFSLNDGFGFIKANRALLSQLHIPTEQITGYRFTDLVYESGEKDYSRAIVEEKLSIFALERQPLAMHVLFKSPVLSEPLEMKVRLEYIDNEGRSEILGKASCIEEDALIPYFEAESQRYCIGNFLITADDLSHRVTRNLRKYMDRRDAGMVRIALREMLINAIEHGNLCVSFEDKTRAMLDETYFKLLAARRSDPRFAGRRVIVEYSVEPGMVVYLISDDGDGFDHRTLATDANPGGEADLLSHGRGINMARNVFDLVEFNEKGNRVRLVKHLDAGRA